MLLLSCVLNGMGQRGKGRAGDALKMWKDKKEKKKKKKNRASVV